MKHTIRFIILIFALVVAGTSNVWAISESDIIINVQPNKDAGTVTVTSISGMTVTISAEPATGYKIDASHITAEKMIDPSNPAASRAPGLAPGLTITDNGGNSYSFTIPDGYIGAYVTVNFYQDAPEDFTQITSLSEIPNTPEGLAGKYQLTADVSGLSTSLGEFTGTLDGGLHKVIGSSAPLFTSTSGSAVIRNIIFEDVNISVSGDAGAVTGDAKGNTRIYNCGINATSTERDNAGNITGFSGSTVSGSGNVGGLVGKLSGNARVINCYSYANITGGSVKAGIVGNNSVASKQSSLTTMVMNCMFYGDISTGGTISPIYGGTEINNVAGGMNNYNYYRYESPYSKEKHISSYNRALAMEEKFITRFERYRLLLNSNKKLAALYATGSAANADQMAKWVLETADRSIVIPLPYPVLKPQGKYPSIINYDAEHAPESTTVGRLNGGKLGKTLAVTIRTKSQKTTGGQTWPTATASDVQTTSLTLTRTDKDTIRYNFNYDKVQLPYYNDVGTGNYTESRVVTGWKITDITGGTSGTYNPADEWGGYNFADRKCTNKDLYGESGRVFSQGAYWDVPEGVTAITIEPYWAIANYVSDATYDVVYNSGYTKQDFTLFGKQYEFGDQNNADIDIYGDGNNQKVYNSISNAIANFNNSSKTVYDQAAVLVGNVHQYDNPTNTNKPYTVMSIDMNHDNEPDYSYIFTHDNRKPIDPIRYDFLNIMGIAEAQIPKGATLLRNVSIFNLKGWFEITNTCVVNFSQFEYDNNKNSKNGVTKSSAPLILLGGTFEQIVSTQSSECGKTKYIHIGSNAWFAKFGTGTHSDGNKFTPHVPISVTGGDYDEFYLSGTYQPNITNMQSDDAECYISGGRFGEMAGASLEAIQGDVRWDINWADITNFYGGGVNAVNPITGDIRVDMTNSHVHLYCGGPKFGDMTEEKKVTTNATGCNFDTFFGAGYGGNAYNRVKYLDQENKEPSSQQSNYASERGKYYDGSTSNTSYGKKGKGVATDFDYEFFVWSNGSTGSRFYVKYITFSLATTHSVTSNLTKCRVTRNVYGGGSLGKVDGNVSTTLDSCEIIGNVFGGGYSATLPKIDVRKTPAFIADKEPKKNMNIGMFEPGEINTTEEYEWKQVASMPANGDPGIKTEDGKNYVYTDTDLSALGTVTGNVTLNITGTTTVGKSVYGGGEESGVDGNTEVTVSGGTIGAQGQGGVEYGNVYGGGKGKNNNVLAGLVKGNTKVTIENTKVGETTTIPTIYHNVYGGGAYGSVGTFTYDANNVITGHTANTGKTELIITGGTFGWNGKENGMVFGSSRGDVGAPGAIEDKLAWVYETDVKIGTSGAGTVFTTPVIMGSVYGGGENGHNYSNASVNIYSGTIGIATGSPVTSNNVEYSGANYPYRGNVYGGGCGTDKYYSGEIPSGHTANDGEGDKYNALAGIVRGNATVTMTGGHVVRNVYGAGAMGSVGTDGDATTGKTTVTISGGRIGVTGEGEGSGNGYVFGAARGELGLDNSYANVRETEVNINYATTPDSDNEGKTEQLIAGSVFGGGEAGTVKESVTVNMTGGLILHDIYGGGALADTQTSNWDATKNENAGGWAEGKTSASATTTVNLTGGTVADQVYGGALGAAGNPAYVYGDVLVELNNNNSGSTADGTQKGCAVREIFACNNINGTPKGNATVHIYATQHRGKSQIVNAEATGTEGQDGYKPAVTDAKKEGSYDVENVYGGGNQAAYNPASPYTAENTTGAKTQVIIEGCDLTSINTVYGGGNAAAVPETNVEIKSAYEINNVFGGGNGKDEIAPGVENPGADVGTLDHGGTTYGTGNANTTLEGGVIHEVYGGSNQKGIIKGSINQTTDPGTDCGLDIEKVVGAGKYADIDGDVNMVLSCQPSNKISQLFAGADEANVNGNITLTITNGWFGQVFGGNNLGGAVKGKIVVNVEETGCQPIKIDELYLGGNQAAYSVFGYYESNKTHSVTGKKILEPRTSADDGHTPVANPSTDATHTFPYAHPELNVISCTYIGQVYGGGYGSGAKMYADPTVNINMIPGRYAAQIDRDNDETADNEAHRLGTIGDVYGGGNAADVIGNTTVNIGTATTANLNTEPIYRRTDAATPLTPNAQEKYEQPVEGVYITGDAFGGGNNADVNGNTYVNICAVKSTATEDYTEVSIQGTDYEGVKILGSVYGGGNLGAVTKDTKVIVLGGTIGTEGEGGAKYGNVYGGGKGSVDPTDSKYVTAGIIQGNTNVTISGSPTILHNIYGGGAYGSVGTFTYDNTTKMPTALATENTGACNVTITGGTIGSNGKENGMVFGSSRGDVATPVGTPAVDPNDRTAWVYSTHVTIGDTGAETSPVIKGSVYGSGENGHTFQNTIVDIKKGTVGIATGETIGDYSGAAYPYRGNVYGGGCGTDMYDSNGDNTKDAYNPLAGIVRGTVTVNITGGHVVHNVYGAGAMGSVGNSTDATSGKTTINISGGRIGYDGDGNGHVFGAARGEFGVSTAASGLANVRETEVNISYPAASTPAEDNTEKTAQLIAGSVFGGGEAGTVKESVVVNMTGGLILHDIYGGGALADTQTSNWDASNNTWATGKTSASATTMVRLIGGRIVEEAFGGGLGEAASTNYPNGKPAYVYGDVLVELNNNNNGETADGTKKGCAVAQIFGCNNINGTPKGKVQVHVYATQNAAATTIGNPAEGEKTAKVANRYDVLAVYGGGNMAAYVPKDLTTGTTNIIIDGCRLTSIKAVYGGGNAASTPATRVTVNGTFEIEELFGGGNGKDDVVKDGVTKPNPGANVGYKDYSEYYQEGDEWKVRDKEDADTKEERLASNYRYGTGQASVNVFGGTIHRVFGGSNTKGNVCQTAVTLLNENSECDFCVDEAYGGGKSAPMDAEAKLLMACIPGLSAAYGGAEAAAIQGNVTLNITNGTFDRIFGGNNLSGTINGSITVNIEEIGCKPIIIGELYGGGNQAGYSVYGYDNNDKPIESGVTPLYNDPQVNVKSFTSIGNIYGGGYGDGATMVGNPTVSINETYGRWYNDENSIVGENVKTPNNYPIPSHAKGKMGAINNVFGGGNAAEVKGSTTVNIGTLDYVAKQVAVGDDVSNYYTLNNDGKYDAATGTATEGTTYYEKVLGADIRGNVYGGGNEAEVTGNTNVNIGRKVNTSTPTTP